MGAGLTEEQLEGLSEEERAALEDEDDAKGKGEGDGGDTDDDKGNTGEGEGDDDDKGKAQDGGDRNGDPGTDEGAGSDKSDAGAAENVAPVNSPLFKLDAGADGKTLEGIAEELETLDEKFEQGDIALKDYNAQRDALNQAKFRLEMYKDMNEQVANQTVENNWKAAQQEFFAENKEYRENPVLNAAYAHVVNGLLATEEGKKLTDRQLLTKAKETVEESLGIVREKGKDKGDAGKAALEAAKRKEAEKGRDNASLSKMLLAESQEIGDRFDALDKLNGEDFENAIAALSESERKAYARRG